MVNAGIMGYTLLIGSTLFFFATYSTCLHLSNVTSNENLRTRWNAMHEVKLERERSRLRAISPGSMNAQEQETFQKMILDEERENLRRPGACEKIRYVFLKRKIPSHIETYMKIKEEEGS